VPNFVHFINDFRALAFMDNYLEEQIPWEGSLSPESLAKKLDVSMSEAIDLLAKVGIEAPIGLDDYLKGFEVLRDK
jgi:hypothetical protein